MMNPGHFPQSDSTMQRLRKLSPMVWKGKDRSGRCFGLRWMRRGRRRESIRI